MDFCRKSIVGRGDIKDKGLKMGMHLNDVKSSKKAFLRWGRETWGQIV